VIRAHLPRALRYLLAQPNIVAGSLVLLVIVLMCAVPPLVRPIDPTAQSISNRFSPPSAMYPLGTDSLGRDVLNRLSIGGRWSLAVAAGAIVIGGLGGIVLGLFAGVGPRSFDRVLSAGVTILMSFPALLIALLTASTLGAGAVSAVLAIAAANVAVFARLTRGEALRIGSEPFLEAARVIGTPPFATVARHFLPNLWPPLIVGLTLRFSTAILTEATLSYLGIGIPPPTPTWGRMILEGQRQLEFAPWVALAPGAAIMLAVLGLNLLGDGLRDVLDPRLRGTGGHEPSL
jgi:ABC-type dipeptide/oligopeptide/nickel transport system permease subunit